MYWIAMEYSVDVYRTENGERPFYDWLEDLRDLKARQKINSRIVRLRAGNFGDCEPVGAGVCELKIDFGPGYRVYFAMAGKKLVLLLIAGTKRTQNKDIEKAKKYLKDFKS